MFQKAGSNKAIHVSDEAIAKGEKRLAESDTDANTGRANNSGNNTNTATTSTGFTGGMFQKAGSNKAIHCIR